MTVPPTHQGRLSPFFSLMSQYWRVPPPPAEALCSPPLSRQSGEVAHAEGIASALDLFLRESILPMAAGRKAAENLVAQALHNDVVLATIHGYLPALR